MVDDGRLQRNYVAVRTLFSIKEIGKIYGKFSQCSLRLQPFRFGFQRTGGTYNNKQKGADNVRARLDRSVASPEWSDYFKNASLEHICSSRSDHLPILLRVGSRTEWRPVDERKKSLFRYEQMWERKETLQPTIVATWNMKGPADDLQKICVKLQQMQKELRSWAERDFGSVIRKTAEIRKMISRLWNSPNTAGRQREEIKLTEELDEMLLREEIMWRQRSRATYLREGDRNTKWFQRKATWRKKKNSIMKLKDENGEWVENMSSIHEMAIFFQKPI